MNNKTLLGVFAVVFIIVGAIWFIRKSPDALKQLKLPFASKQVKTTPTPPVNSVLPEQPNNASNPASNAQVPSSLVRCTEEIRSQPCNSLPVKEVCGYDKTAYPDGRIEVHALSYNTSCHYCAIFGTDDRLSMGDVQLTALGFENSACK